MRNFLVTLLLIAGLSPAMRAGVDGQWTIPIAGSDTGILLELKSDGGRVTGSLSGPNGKLDIVNGSISANTISFETVTKVNGSAIALFTGQVNGDAIELTVRTRDRAGKQRLTAKRRDPNAPPPDWFSKARRRMRCWRG